MKTYDRLVQVIGKFIFGLLYDREGNMESIQIQSRYKANTMNCINAQNQRIHRLVKRLLAEKPNGWTS